MFNIGGAELLVILLVALLVLGPDKLPGAARQAGRFVAEARRITGGFRDELETAFDAERGASSASSPAAPPAPATEPARPDDRTEATP